MKRPTSWELLATRRDPAADCMRIDEHLLESGPQMGAALVRFYTWATPSLSFGANQTLGPEIDDRCAAAGVETVRRPTGGGAVLHDGDVTYAVVAPIPSDGVLATYRWVAEPLIEGFARMGLDARVVEHSGAGRTAACFASPTGADLEVGGRKVCGSAQVRRAGWFLQHGSIPIADVRGLTSHLLGTDEADHSTCLGELVPGMGPEQVISAMAEAFAESWGEPRASLPNPLVLL